MPTSAPAGLRHIAARLNPDAAPDGELLARFLEHRDEVAFAALVRRHAAMVFATCRRVLGNAADADDAFQAAFVVLVRKAHAFTGRATVGNFLYGVAFRTALKVKTMATRRSVHESRAQVPEPRADQSELLTALDEELAKLPDKYREPVVLCELEGRSRRETAETLGVAEGTLSSRLATAHRMLEKQLRARGFAGVVLAAVFATQRVAVAETLTEAAVRAVVAPVAAVSQLASEVTKMTLLHNLGIGVAAVAIAFGMTAVVAASLPTKPPAIDPPKAKGAPGFGLLAAPVPAAPEPAWKTEFRKIYGLKDGELVRRVAPPYPECRAEYFKDRIREAFKRSKLDPSAEALNKDFTDYFTKFGWKDGWLVDQLTAHTVPVKPDEGVRLSQLLNMTAAFSRSRLDADAEILETKVTGDWVVRAGADPAKLASALEAIVRKECGLKVTIAVKDAEREVYVLSGKYAAKPLPGRKENEIEVYASEVFDSGNRGGGGGTFEAMADHVERWINFPILLGKIEDAPKTMHWHLNNRIPASPQPEESDPDAVLKNVAAQTGLTVKKEKWTIQVLTVKKDG